jgi:hypothetical protein
MNREQKCEPVLLGGDAHTLVVQLDSQSEASHRAYQDRIGSLVILSVLCGTTNVAKAENNITEDTKRQCFVTTGAGPVWGELDFLIHTGLEPGDQALW